MRTIVLYKDEKGQHCCIWSDLEKEGNEIINGVEFFKSHVKEWQNSEIVGLEDFEVPENINAEAFLVRLGEEINKTKKYSIKEILVYLNREVETTVTRE